MLGPATVRPVAPTEAAMRAAAASCESRRGRRRRRRPMATAVMAAGVGAIVTAVRGRRRSGRRVGRSLELPGDAIARPHPACHGKGARVTTASQTNSGHTECWANSLCGSGRDWGVCIYFSAEGTCWHSWPSQELVTKCRRESAAHHIGAVAQSLSHAAQGC